MLQTRLGIIVNMLMCSMSQTGIRIIVNLVSTFWLTDLFPAPFSRLIETNQIKSLFFYTFLNKVL